MQHTCVTQRMAMVVSLIAQPTMHSPGCHTAQADAMLYEACSMLKLSPSGCSAGTLAYGINMPCRTVVFAGDHIFLNSLQFRQMTGRAGRRGFDTLGHVVFWAVPSRKCTSLLVSPVPRLHGNFPMSVSLSLRLLTLHSAAPEDAQLQNDLLRLLQRPFYACEDPQLQQKMQHLFQFSLQYLQLQDALNAQGRPVQLAGMAMHLFWTEPANFAFVTLLRKGVFHRICDGVKATADAPLSDNVADEMLLVLSHGCLRGCSWRPLYELTKRASIPPLPSE